MFKDVIFYLLWYNVIRWSIYIHKKSFFSQNIFLSFYSVLTLSWRRPLSHRNQSIDLLCIKFSEWHSGSDGVPLTKCDKVEWGKKMPLCKWHTFWMALCLLCYFVAILFYIERKWFHMRNWTTSQNCMEIFSVSML